MYLIHVTFTTLLTEHDTTYQLGITDITNRQYGGTSKNFVRKIGIR
jgi:hypothetical protein